MRERHAPVLCLPPSGAPNQFRIETREQILLGDFLTESRGSRGTESLRTLACGFVWSQLAGLWRSGLAVCGKHYHEFMILKREFSE